MNLNPVEIEQVLEYWSDISQDVDLISRELEIDRVKVIEILEHLQMDGQIKNYKPMKMDEDRILKFNELVNELGVKDDRYFYKEKKINQAYDLYAFIIEVYTILFSPNGYLDISVAVEYNGSKYPFKIVYYSDDTIYHTTTKKDTIKMREIMEILGEENAEKLKEGLDDILDSLVPDDFWKVRSDSN